MRIVTCRATPAALHLSPRRTTPIQQTGASLLWLIDTSPHNAQSLPLPLRLGVLVAGRMTRPNSTSTRIGGFAYPNPTTLVDLMSPPHPATTHKNSITSSIVRPSTTPTWVNHLILMGNIGPVFSQRVIIACHHQLLIPIATAILLSLVLCTPLSQAGRSGTKPSRIDLETPMVGPLVPLVLGILQGLTRPSSDPIVGPRHLSHILVGIRLRRPLQALCPYRD